MEIRPFRIDVPKADLEDLRRRLGATRWAGDFGNADWRYGVERGWLEEMVAWWRDTYDWRAAEAAMNRWPQCRAEIDGVPIHFLHVKGKGPDPTPLILTHGWPWTFRDFARLIGPLTDPAAHGGDPAQSFDLVIPSLPGFGFSTPLRTTGIDVPAIAALWVRLMTEGLGYARFAASGGDFGAIVTAHLGHAHEDRLIGCHLMMGVYPGMPYAPLDPADVAADEQWMPEQLAKVPPLILSHLTTQRLDPQTLAYALVDSPVGTAAWIWERRRAWSDCGGDLLSIHDRDELCTLASIYWLTGAIGSSLRLYYEQFHDGIQMRTVHDRRPAIAVPTAYAVFPKDMALIPRAVAARNTDLRQWTVMPKGGHFGAAEQPALVVEDLRRFFHRPECIERRSAGH
jgi:pimeloyl-ACP methyl ester carboxylesterase